MIRPLMMVQSGESDGEGKNGHSQVWDFEFACVYHGIYLAEAKWILIGS